MALATGSLAMWNAVARSSISSTRRAPTPAPTIAPSAASSRRTARASEKTEIVALSKVDAVDQATLKQQMDRLKRAIRSFGPPVTAEAKRAKPFLLSTATRSGVTEVLRATMAA